MSMIVKENGGAEIPMLEAGVYTAYSNALVDLGVQRSEKFQKDIRKFRIIWVICEEEVEINGEKYPRTVSKEYSFSLGEKSTLRKDLQSWRGQPFTADELTGFDLTNILNKACQLQIIVEEKDGKHFNNIAGIMALPKGTTIEVPKTGYVFDTYEQQTYTNYEKIPKFMQERIKQAIGISDELKAFIKDYDEFKVNQTNTAECGHHIIGDSCKNGKGVIYRYYTCMNRKKGANCRLPSIRKNEIEEAMNDLQKALSNYKDYQKDYAVKEYNYRTALSKELVRLRAEGQAVTHLADIARGKPEIAKLRFERDIAEGLVNSASEGINFYKLKIRELEAQYNREYGNPRLGTGG